MQDQNSKMRKVLIRMVGKRTSTKSDSSLARGCNGLADTNCWDYQSPILTKLGILTAPQRQARLGGRKEPTAGFRNAAETDYAFLTPIIEKLYRKKKALLNKYTKSLNEF